MNLARWLPAWSGFIVLCLMAGCDQQAPKVEETPPPVVTVAKPLEKMVSDHEDFTGRTEAVESVEIRARVSGYLEKIFFKPGAEVKKDEMLYEIDRRPYLTEVDQAKAIFARSEAGQKRAQAEYDRSKRLQAMGSDAISKEELERALAMRDEAIASVAASKASLAKAELNLQFTQILAPVAGRVSKSNLTVGNLVMADSTLLTTVVSQDPIYAAFDVDDRTVLRLQRLTREGQTPSARDAKLPILLGVQNEVGYPHAGEIEFVDNQVNSGTGTLKVRGVFNNSDRVLTPGLFVRLQVPIGKPRRALLVNDRAIGVDQGQKYVLVMEKDKDGKDVVGYRQIKAGEAQDGLRVIEEGLKADDRVIVIGMQRVRPGVRVDAKEGEMPTRETQGKAASAKAAEPAKTTAPAQGSTPAK